MSENINLDIGTIYRQERTRWMKEEAPRRTFRDVVATSVPYWIVIVALVLFGLSAPHTAKIFNMITPGWGVIAPVGVEFGLLYASFRRRLARSDGIGVPWTLWAMEVLLFVTAILVNGTGAFVSVVTATNLEALSFSAILEQFTSIPATSQAALIMAALSSLIIPIGTLVAGDGLADLTLAHREHIDFREERWQEVEFTVIYRAVFGLYLRKGMPNREARKRAASEVKGFLGDGRASGVRSLSAGSGQTGQSEHNPNGHTPPGSIKDSINSHLDEHPELLQQSVNGVLAALQDAGVSAGRTSVAEVLRERKETQ